MSNIHYTLIIHGKKLNKNNTADIAPSELFLEADVGRCSLGPGIAASGQFSLWPLPSAPLGGEMSQGQLRDQRGCDALLSAE